MTSEAMAGPKRSGAGLCLDRRTHTERRRGRKGAASPGIALSGVSDKEPGALP